MRVSTVLALVLAAVCLLPATAAAETWVVDRGEPGGTACQPESCSLRQAINLANAGAPALPSGPTPDGLARHWIRFAPEVNTITLDFPLPAVTQRTHIDGLSGRASRPLIIPSLSSTGSSHGLALDGSTALVEGVQLRGFQRAVQITGDNNVVRGNRIGAEPGATGGTNVFGIFVAGGTGNVIGGAGELRNVIVGNLNFGIWIESGDANYVDGNLIGARSDVVADPPLGNGGGIAIESDDNIIAPTSGIPGSGGVNVIQGSNEQGIVVSGEDNKIDGALIGGQGRGNSGDGIVVASGGSAQIGFGPLGNTVGGNGGVGVRIAGGSATTLTGNRIGVDATGAAVPNAGGGVEAASGALTDNVVSGNTGFGVRASGPVTLLRNKVGTNAAGTAALPNSGDGVVLAGAGATVGATGSGEGNTIAHNGGAGVRVTESASGNQIVGNSIFSNGGLGIDLEPQGVTTNDGGDADGGANGGQNAPVVTAVTRGAAGHVAGTLDSRPGVQFRIQIFRTTDGEGKDPLANLDVTTDGSGHATFETGVGALAAEDDITATATALDTNETSEFGGATMSIADVTIEEGDAGSKTATLTVTRTAPLGAPATVQWSTVAGTAGAGTDFTSSSGTLSFDASEATKVIEVAVVGDTDEERTETFGVVLSNPTRALIADGNGVVTVTDADLPPPLPGRTVSGPPWSGDSSFTFNGAASERDGRVRLTGEPLQAGSAFTPVPVIDPDEPFRASFEVELHGGSGGGADGLAFVLQRDPRGAAALGDLGGNLGYGQGTADDAAPPITPSVVVELDTHDNSPDGYDDPNGNHLAVVTGGEVGAPLASAPVPFSLYGGGSRFVWVEYAGKKLSVYVAETDERPDDPLLEVELDLVEALGGPARAGFTAATGGDWALQEVAAWKLENTKHPTETTLECTHDRCNVAVAEAPATTGARPGGSVSFSGGGSCSLDAAPAPATSRCTHVPEGPGDVTATYPGDAQHFGSTATATVPPAGGDPNPNPGPNPPPGPSGNGGPPPSGTLPLVAEFEVKSKNIKGTKGGLLLPLTVDRPGTLVARDQKAQPIPVDDLITLDQPITVRTPITVNRIRAAARRPKKPKALIKRTKVVAAAAGTVKLRIQLTKTGKQQLRKRRKLTLSVAVIFQPTEGGASARVMKLKLKARRRR